jgi:hypothetical protein
MTIDTTPHHEPCETAEDAMADVQYQIIISLSDTTIDALVNSGFWLYAFKAVQSTDRAGRPLIWYRTENFSTTTEVYWTDSFQAYTSSNSITTGGTIRVGYVAEIETGQTMKVRAGGLGEVVTGGLPADISILNTTSTQFTCGMSESVGGAIAPLCAFPLYGGFLQTITPLNNILLMFSTQQLLPGTVIGEPAKVNGTVLLDAYSPALMVDLTNAPDNTRSVKYDINKGWDWGGYNWAFSVPANANLVPLLIEP